MITNSPKQTQKIAELLDSVVETVEKNRPLEKKTYLNSGRWDIRLICCLVFIKTTPRLFDHYPRKRRSSRRLVRVYRQAGISF